MERILELLEFYSRLTFWLVIYILLFDCSQGGDGPARWPARGTQKATQRFPVTRLLQTRLPRAQDALLFQT